MEKYWVLHGSFMELGISEYLHMYYIYIFLRLSVSKTMYDSCWNDAHTIYLQNTLMYTATYELQQCKTNLTKKCTFLHKLAYQYTLLIVPLVIYCYKAWGPSA